MELDVDFGVGLWKKASVFVIQKPFLSSEIIAKIESFVKYISQVSTNFPAFLFFKHFWLDINNLIFLESKIKEDICISCRHFDGIWKNSERGLSFYFDNSRSDLHPGVVSGWENSSLNTIQINHKPCAFQRDRMQLYVLRNVFSMDYQKKRPEGWETGREKGTIGLATEPRRSYTSRSWTTDRRSKWRFWLGMTVPRWLSRP